MVGVFPEHLTLVPIIALVHEPSFIIAHFQPQEFAESLERKIQVVSQLLILLPQQNEGIEKVAWLSPEQITEALQNSYENIKLLFETEKSLK